MAVAPNGFVSVLDAVKRTHEARRDSYPPCLAEPPAAATTALGKAMARLADTLAGIERDPLAPARHDLLRALAPPGEALKAMMRVHHTGDWIEVPLNAWGSSIGLSLLENGGFVEPGGDASLLATIFVQERALSAWLARSLSGAQSQGDEPDPRQALAIEWMIQYLTQEKAAGRKPKRTDREMIKKCQMATGCRVDDVRFAYSAAPLGLRNPRPSERNAASRA